MDGGQEGGGSWDNNHILGFGFQEETRREADVKDVKILDWKPGFQWSTRRNYLGDCKHIDTKKGELFKREVAIRVQWCSVQGRCGLEGEAQIFPDLPENQDAGLSFITEYCICLSLSWSPFQ
jgi:hypothetical protein